MPPKPGFKQHSMPNPDLPVASFRKVVDDNRGLEGVHDAQAQSYGFNDPNRIFKRTEAYIRYIEPLESELAKQVEYDMDEQDQEWLDQVNQERKKSQFNAVSCETFEIIIDKIEKEWFELVKRLPKPDAVGPNEDSTCAICDDAEVENTNAIVFCDGCNLAVHQECYGVPYIPEGQWLCRKCQLSPEHPVGCALCPNEGGAFKQTTSGEWAHLLCAMYIAETGVGNSVIQEPIEGIERIEKARWKLTCSICGLGSGNGACIQCAKTQCYTAYHTTCARKLKLLMPMKGAEGEKLQLTSYCTKHVPGEQAAAHLAALKATRNSSRASSPSSSSPIEPLTPAGAAVIDSPKSKAARAYAKSYTLGAPLVPAVIVNNVLSYIHKISVHKKIAFVQMVCRYWSLKREARRGAPLLKRLHLEPWSSGGSDEKLSKEARNFKLERIIALRKDLEAVRLISDITRKRESEKLHQAMVIKELVDSVLLPHESDLRMVFEKVQAKDTGELFKNPVSKQLVPDYFDIVKEPMCWSQIDAKLDRHEYWEVADLRRDIELVFDNALLYNKRETPLWKAANRLKPLVAIAFDQFKLEENPSLPGDLQPPLAHLNLLFSREQIEEVNTLELTVDPIESVFNYELGVEKPEPPKPRKPRPPKKPKRERPPRDYVAERARRKARLEAQREEASTQEAVEPPQPEYRARTRGEAARLAEAVSIADSSVAASVGPTVVGAEDAEDDESSAKRNRPRREAMGPPPTAGPSQGQGQAQTSDLILVDSVSKEQSFKRFNDGWILPPSATRNSTSGATSIEPPSPTKPTPSTSRAPRGNRARNRRKREPSQKKGRSSAKKGAADASAARSVAKDLSGFELSELSDISHEEEEHDGGEEGEEERPQENEEEHGEPPESTEPDAEEMDNELPRNESPEAEAVRHLKLWSKKTLEGGTLVWAKMESYPFWPAVVYEPDTNGIPQSVLNNLKSVIKKEPGPLHLVQFYDKSSSWQWLPPSKLYLLGDDEKFDGLMLAGKTSLQRYKTSRLKSDCRKAFRRAMAEMEVDNDIEGGGTEDGGEEGEGDVEEGSGSGKVTVDAEIQTSQQESTGEGVQEQGFNEEDRALDQNWRQAPVSVDTPYHHEVLQHYSAPTEIGSMNPHLGYAPGNSLTYPNLNPNFNPHISLNPSVDFVSSHTPFSPQVPLNLPHYPMTHPPAALGGGSLDQLAQAAIDFESLHRGQPSGQLLSPMGIGHLNPFSMGHHSMYPLTQEQSQIQMQTRSQMRNRMRLDPSLGARNVAAFREQEEYEEHQMELG